MALSRILLVLTATTIFVIGIVMIFSTSSAEVIDHELAKSTHQAFLKQVYYAFAGLILAFGLIRIGHLRLLSYTPWLLAGFTFLLVITLIPGIGHEVNGSRRWLHLGGFSFQPSEFIKYIIPSFFIFSCLRYSKDEFLFKDFIKLLIIISAPMLLILVEPNNGTTAVIGATLLALFLLLRIHFRYWAWPLLGFALVLSVFAAQHPYVSARLKVYLNPELDLKGKGHQPHQAKIAAGSGKLWGKGPGNSLQKLSYLPEAQNDYIGAIYAEEFGFIGLSVLVCLYLLLMGEGFYIAYHSKYKEGFLLAACSTFLIAFQAFLNLGVVSGLLPSTGLNLPLFSQGGSSLMANIMGLALLISVSFESDLSSS